MSFFEAIPLEVLEKIGELELKIESENCHQAIDELLSQTVLSGGKRLRPMLTYLMGLLFENKDTLFSPAASGLEPSRFLENNDFLFSGVGGIAELTEAAQAPLEAESASGPGAALLVAAGVLAGVASIGGAAWYARRRLR